MRSRVLVLFSILLVLACQVPRARAILGGSDAAEGEFPWIAGIVRRDVPAPGLIGGGTLVGDQWVITAAHSVEGLTATDLEVWLGITDLNDNESRLSARVLAIHIHPDFVSENGTSVNDLALLLLDRRISTILPIPLVEDDADLGVGDAVHTAGWGTTMNGANDPSMRLQKAEAEIVSQMAASSVFGGGILSSHLPAKDPADTAGPCVGDSGGPLVRKVAGTDRLAGLVSFGSLPCDPGLPAVYTRIPSFLAWITERLDLTSSPPKAGLSGNGRAVSPDKTAKKGNGTDFGDLGGGSRRATAFQLRNEGSGLLTVRSTVVSGRGFSLRKPPAPVIAAGGTTTVRVSLSAPRRPKRLRGKLVLFTNDPLVPSYRVRIEGRSR